MKALLPSVFNPGLNARKQLILIRFVWHDILPTKRTCTFVKYGYLHPFMKDRLKCA